jgi:hypothetical protein
MAAATIERDTKSREKTRFDDPVAAGVKIYLGTLVVLDAAGNARPGRASTTDTVRGLAQATVDNSAGAAGAMMVSTHTGTFLFDNLVADPITRVDINKNAYVADDQSVARTDGAGTRIVAGKISDVTTAGVWVEINR